MKIRVEEQGQIGACCYMFCSEKAAVIIDPAMLSPTLNNFITDNKGKEFYILVTHRHFDHVAGVCDVKNACGGQVVISALDECGLMSTRDSMGARFGIDHKLTSADILVNDGDKLTLGDITLTVMLTPGHTEGSVCYIADDCIFSGDTLFFGSIGRTDFPTGDMEEMQCSLSRLFELSGDYTVYPGHGEPTTLRFEEKNNPFYRNFR